MGSINGPNKANPARNGSASFEMIEKKIDYPK